TRASGFLPASARSLARRFPGDFRALLSRFTEADRDRLLPAFHAASRSALQRALLATMHCRLHRSRCRFAIFGHKRLGAQRAKTMLNAVVKAQRDGIPLSMDPAPETIEATRKCIRSDDGVPTRRDRPGVALDAGTPMPR